MIYLGSKNRIAKELVPIIQSFITTERCCYVEPFVGGANVIDKIDAPIKIGSDIHKELIALLRAVQSGQSLPLSISEEEWKTVRDNKELYPSWYVGLVGFCASFSAKYFGGFARGGGTRDRSVEMIRNLEKQRSHLQGIIFKCQSYEDIDVSNSVIYCDPPYRNTTKYSTKSFDYEKFYEWCRQMAKKGNIVLVSEYDMPAGFECIWSKQHYVNLASKRISKQERVEKLYLCKGNAYVL